MKRKITSLGIISLFLFNGYVINAQSVVEKVTYDPNGSVSMVVFKKGTDKATVMGVSGKASSLSLNKILKISDKVDLRFNKSELGLGKFRTETYQTYINGIVIEGGEYKMNYKDDSLLSIAGKGFNTDNLSQTSPKISESAALNFALKDTNASSYAWQDKSMDIKNFKQEKPKGELVFVPIEAYGGEYTLVLAYKFDIFATKPLSRNYVYVDAETGLIIKKDAIIKHVDASDNRPSLKTKKITVKPFDSENSRFDVGNAETRYSGVRSINSDYSTDEAAFTLYDETSRPTAIWTANMQRTTSTANVIEFEDDDNNWTAAEHKNANKDDAALDAHWGVTKTYDFFKTKFGRESYDNAGAPLISLVHYDVNYDNAFWGGNLMVYGDGGTQFDALTAFDITAHELGHAVTGASSKLVYNRESGALNEGMSDIWAALVEHEYAPEKQPFLIGEDVSLKGPFLRSMSNPKGGDQPDTYKGVNWWAASVEDGCVYPSQTGNDYCGVHTNSGVLNHWFYILVQGKTGTNDLGNSYSVQGIGWDKAGQIAYLLQTGYLTANSNFNNARDYAIQAATDLFGGNSVEAIAVQDAFYAVGIGGKYLTTPDTTPPTNPINLSAANTTGDATTLSWNASTDDNGIWEYIIYNNNIEVARTSKLNYRVTGLKQNTNYTFTIKALDQYKNLSAASNQAPVTTTALKTVCLSTAYNSTILNITNVQLNTINNPSTIPVGYEDFSYLNTELEAGKTYDLNVTASTAQYTSNYALFLDKDNSGGSFLAADRIASASLTQGKPVTTITFTVPSDAITDTPVKLRLIQSNGTLPLDYTGCIGFTFGQVEDYSVTIKASTLGVKDLNTNGISVFPNPTKDFLNVSNTGKEFKYSIYSTSGNLVISGVSKGQIDVQKLPKGVYVLNLNVDDTVKNLKFIKE